MAKVLVNFQDEFLQEIDKIAEVEHRTRSSLIREALRRYLSQYSSQQQFQKESETKALPVVPSSNKTTYTIQRASWFLLAYRSNLKSILVKIKVVKKY